MPPSTGKDSWVCKEILIFTVKLTTESSMTPFYLQTEKCPPGESREGTCRERLVSLKKKIKTFKCEEKILN